MKKLTPFLLMLCASIFLFSCRDNNDNYIDNDTYSSVYDFKNINLNYTSTNTWHYYYKFASPIYSSDVILMYRQTGSTNDGSPIWQQIPRTMYITVAGEEEELDYDFDFSRYDFTIYAGGTYDLATTPQYIKNQNFRLVIIPAGFGGKNAANDLSKLSYEEVIKKFNIDDSHPKVLK